MWWWCTATSATSQPSAFDLSETSTALNLSTMRLSLFASLANLSATCAFTPAAFTRGLNLIQAPVAVQQSTLLFSGPEEEEGEGLDLDLEEMFDMFDAAEKEEDFEDAINKVKKGEDE